MIYIHGATIYTPHEEIKDGGLFVSKGNIVQIGKSNAMNIPDGAQVVDATGLILTPGFIDLQINGAFGHNFTSDPYSLWKVAAELPRFGVTSFLPTIITSPLTTFSEAQKALGLGNLSDKSGAIPLGWHFEGPFLNPLKKGAHNQAYFHQPDLDKASNWSLETGVRLVTLAPELPNAMEMIMHLHKNGIVVSAGHSMASFEQAQAAINAGVTYGTHLFNAMHPLDHRNPGLVAALLEDNRCAIGLIADGIHLHPAIVKLIASNKEKINLVTDAVAALGLQPGKYHFGDRDVAVSQSDVRLTDGTLAGSILSLDQALRNMIKFSGCSLDQALKMITFTPASVLGIQDSRGQLSPGMVADMVLLTPELQVLATILAGEIVYHKEGMLI